LVLSDVQNRSGGALSENVNSQGATSTILDVLSPITLYYIEVWAVDDFGNSETTNHTSITTLPPPAPTYTAPKEAEEIAAKYSVYQVNTSDLLKIIADKLGITVERFKELNSNQGLDLTQDVWSFKTELGANVLLQAIADEVGITIERLLELNKEEPLDITKDIWDIKYYTSDVSKTEEIKNQEETQETEPKQEEAAQTPIFEIRRYIVKSGDNLSNIALKLYGDANRWYDLVKLNQDRYPSLVWNYGVISVGWELRY
jgi:LysM repeat protein